jgi:WD40 repeat protein
MDSSNPISLVPRVNGEISLAWSPDGKKIAYISSDINGNYDIFSIDADGSHQRRLTTTGVDQYAYPAWSPDSSKIAYMSCAQSGCAIYTMNADGSNQTRMIETDVSWFAWSP